MNNEIGEAIARLVADAEGLKFTGFITNARQPNPPVLEGEVWQHIRAEASGKFADGHRIQTSCIVEIRAHGDSLWVETENGSRYGILSFAPLGWLYFSNLHRAFSQLDPAPEGTPIFDVNPSRRALPPLAIGAFREKIEQRLVRERMAPQQKVGTAKPFRPASNPDYLGERMESTHDSIAALRRNGVNIPARGE
jgi:hypothetical protein